MLLLALAAVPSLVINEVLYDPEGPDSGREFVEILNVSAGMQPLRDVELQSADGAREPSWRSMWKGGPENLEPGQFFVVAGESVTVRNGTLSGSLQNGPDALRLVRGGETLDLLGYGTLQSPQLFEGAPAEDVTGRSLSRLPDGHDTDVNGDDFRSAVPSPGRRNAPRRALSLALRPPDATHLWPWRSLVVPVRIQNVGLEALTTGTYGLLASLHRVLGEPAIEPWTRGEAGRLEVAGALVTLVPGDSVETLLRWNGELGLFQIRIALQGETLEVAPPVDSLFVRVGAGPILVNEILFAPDANGREWIELLNRDDRPHDLNGWTLEDATGKPAMLRAGAPLAAGGYALVEADTMRPAPEIGRATLRVQGSPWPSLNNTDGETGDADAVVLRDAAGIVDDALRYRAAWGSGKGRSIERLTVEPDARGLLWAACKDPQGSTPGRKNSATAPPGWSTQLRLEPNPFTPDGDGDEDLLVIAFEVPAGLDGFQLRLFDSSGRRRRHLGGDRLGAGPRRLVWDGTDDAGQLLETGVYVLQLELVGGEATQSELRSVGLVRP